MIAAMGDIDAAISVASFRAETEGWTRPRFTQPGMPVRLTDIRHPLVANAVPNSLQLGPPHGVLVTPCTAKDSLFLWCGAGRALPNSVWSRCQ